MHEVVYVCSVRGKAWTQNTLPRKVCRNDRRSLEFRLLVPISNSNCKPSAAMCLEPRPGGTGHKWLDSIILRCGQLVHARSNHFSPRTLGYRGRDFPGPQKDSSSHPTCTSVGSCHKGADHLHSPLFSQMIAAALCASMYVGVVYAGQV